MNVLEEFKLTKQFELSLHQDPFGAEAVCAARCLTTLNTVEVHDLRLDGGVLILQHRQLLLHVFLQGVS